MSAVVTDGFTDEELEQRAQVAEAAMSADGVATHEKVQEDYFGFEVLEQTFLPDGISWVQHQVFNEGARKRYLNSINRDITMRKATGDMSFRMQQGTERHELLKTAIVGWNLTRNGQPVPFSPHTLSQFLESAAPKIIDLIEKDVRKANPWLLAEVSIEDIDKEIAELTELRQKKLDEEEGNVSSSSK